VVRSSTAIVLVVTMALIVGLTGSVTATDKSERSKDVPPDLVPPASAVLLFELGAHGVQIYTCQADPNDATAFVWTFTAPEAELLNARDEVVGRHFAGPTWQGQDGSAVVGKVLARADAPNRKAIPWLLLEAKAHEGGGVFSMITHIQRLDTAGGVAPGEGCDEAHPGAVVRVPYEATYAFYYPAAPSA
jgi:hypothetical protein